MDNAVNASMLMGSKKQSGTGHAGTTRSKSRKRHKEHRMSVAYGEGKKGNAKWIDNLEIAFIHQSVRGIV